MNPKAIRRLRSILVVLLMLWATLSTVLAQFPNMTNYVYSDAALFTYIGQQWAAGRVPYKYVFDNKPPGIYAVFATTTSLFHDNPHAIAAIEFSTVVIAALLMVAIACQGRMRQSSTLTAVVAFCIATSITSLNEHGRLPEIYVIVPMLLSAACFVHGRWRVNRWTVAAGVAAALAFLFKPIGLAVLFAEVAFLFFFYYPFTGRKLANALSTLGAQLAGMVAAFAPVSFYFWRKGALASAIDAVVVSNLHYAGASNKSILVPLVCLSYGLRVVSSVCLFAAIGTVMLLFRRLLPLRDWDERRQIHAFCLLWFLFDLCGAAAGGRYFGHYFYAVLPSLSLCAAFALDRLLDELEPLRVPALRHSLFAMLLLPLGFAQVDDYVGVLIRHSHMERKTVDASILAAVQRHVRPGITTMFAWPYEPELYYMSGAVNSLSILSSLPLYDSRYGYQRFGQQLLTELPRKRPDLIVDVDGELRQKVLAGVHRIVSTGLITTVASVVLPQSGVDEVPPNNPVYLQFRTFLEQQYTSVYRGADMILYERNDLLAVENEISKPSMLASHAP